MKNTQPDPHALIAQAITERKKLDAILREGSPEEMAAASATVASFGKSTFSPEILADRVLAATLSVAGPFEASHELYEMVKLYLAEGMKAARTYGQDIVLPKIQLTLAESVMFGDRFLQIVEKVFYLPGVGDEVRFRTEKPVDGVTEGTGTVTEVNSGRRNHSVKVRIHGLSGANGDSVEWVFMTPFTTFWRTEKGTANGHLG